MTKATQCEKVMAHMKVFGSISQREAYKMGIYRLSARVWDLRHAGHNVVTDKRRVRNADGTITSIAVYRLGENA